MNITAIEPHQEVKCKICGEYGTLRKNIGDYCYECLRKYKVIYPEYIKPEQHYLFMKGTLEKEFDKVNNT
jgi:hypothetical protein